LEASSNVEGFESITIFNLTMRPEYLFGFLLSLKVPLGVEFFYASFIISRHQVGFHLIGGFSKVNSILSFEGYTGSSEVSSLCSYGRGEYEESSGGPSYSPKSHGISLARRKYTSS
jgi:hypothetical protein